MDPKSSSLLPKGGKEEREEQRHQEKQKKLYKEAICYKATKMWHDF